MVSFGMSTELRSAGFAAGAMAVNDKGRKRVRFCGESAGNAHRRDCQRKALLRTLRNRGRAAFGMSTELRSAGFTAGAMAVSDNGRKRVRFCGESET